MRDLLGDVLGMAAQGLFARAGDVTILQDARAVEEVMLRVLEELKPAIV